MKRRKFILSTGTIGLAASLSGCTEDAQEVLDHLPTAGHHSIGQSIEYADLEITPVVWLTTEEFTFDRGNGETDRILRTDDMIFLFTKIEILNTGLEPRAIPKEGLESSETAVRIGIYHDGNQLPSWGSANAVQLVSIGEEELTPYEQAKRDENSTEYVEPGVTVNGWLIYEISRNFDPRRTMLVVQWEEPISDAPTPSDGYDVIVEENPHAFGWEFGEDYEISEDELPRYTLDSR